jgi:uncharacterized lipoprotein YajG
MNQASALALIGILLLAGCAAIMQFARVIARARLRRRRKMMRMCSVVVGVPAEASNDQCY